MIRIFSSNNKKFLKSVNKSESELNRFLSENWNDFFPHLKFIKSEFSLEGNVRSRGTAGRIDILAFNPQSKKFVVIELKRDLDKNIRNQASDYKDFVEDNFANIYLLTIQKYNVNLPKFTEISKETIDLILISKEFNNLDVDKAKKSKGEITLIRYMWFEEELLLIDYLNNDPLELIEKENTEKLKKIKAIIDNKPIIDNITEIDMFFHKKDEAKRLFLIFYELLKTLSSVEIETQQTKVKVSLKEHTFSIMGSGGKGPRKAFLQVNTDLDAIMNLTGIDIDDRIRPGAKKKGSLGVERYEVYLKNEEDVYNFFEVIKGEI
ncbi:MAG: hypothetical protein HYZ54_05650 [Ignavibacteriae bacterium]|nr:hypothetical protein [Ignavibacteriota bacterium]